MANFPTYTIDPASIDAFMEALRERGGRVEKTRDEELAGRHYREYDATFEEGGRLVFWTDAYADDGVVTITIGNPSGRPGRKHLDSAVELLDASGERLGRRK